MIKEIAGLAITVTIGASVSDVDLESIKDSIEKAFAKTQSSVVLATKREVKQHIAIADITNSTSNLKRYLEGNPLYVKDNYRFNCDVDNIGGFYIKSENGKLVVNICNMIGDEFIVDNSMKIELLDNPQTVLSYFN